ncbi:RNA polymerase sigma factor SigJ [Streptomyces spiralis]|nr:RNA polymerase sigma factor SigJ [Streptomyces spiralis]
MNEPNAADEVAAVFEELRPRLVGVAYSILGTLSEAEDAVQEAWIRLHGSEVAAIEDLTGWLVTTTSRIALDGLRSARARREAYVGPWLPEPVETAPDPADSVSLADSLSWALMVVLETLSPAERAAFVLHDVFGLSFTEVGAALGRSPAACRKLASRARAHVEQRKPRFDVDPQAHQEIVGAFAEAVRTGDMAGLTRLLDPEAVLTTDGGGVVRAVLEPLRGADDIARFFARGARFAPDREFRVTRVNGGAALLMIDDGRLSAVVALTISEGRVTRIDAVRNPHKFHGLHPLGEAGK